MKNKVYVGIDLGTTNTLVAYEKKNRITTLSFMGSGNVLPSVLFLDSSTQTITIGSDANVKGNLEPENRIKSAKTFMGTDKIYELPVKNGEPVSMTPTDVATEVLKAVKARIIKKLKLTDDDEICAVITVPAAFSAIQKEETRKAAEKAGLNCLGLRPEPVAAALAGAEGLSANSMVFVVDIGGGTYDTAVIYLDENLNPEIISQEGDRRLGGDDFDKVIYDYLLEKVGDNLGVDLSSEFDSKLPRELYLTITAEIHDRSREVKEQLSNTDECYANFNKFIIDGYNDNKPIEMNFKITTEKFNSLCKDIYNRIEERLDKSIVALKNKGHSINEITHLVLVGGSCYIPAVIDLCEKKIGKKSSMQCDKTTAVAEGAGIIANNWSVIGEDMRGQVAQSMGVKIAGEKFSKIIEKGSYYPCKKSEIYTTTYDNQDVVRIAIYYAAPDKENCEDIIEHEYYGYFMLDNIQKAKAGVPQIEVTFDFDSNEQLTVTATDIATKSSKTIKVDRSVMLEEDTKRSKPTAIDLLIDCSGSMSGEPLADAKNACRKLISDVVDLSVNEVGITKFSNSAVSICNLTSDKKKLIKSIDEMTAWGGTSMMKGIESSYEKLLKSSKSDKIIFLMTDGAPNGGDHSEIIAKKMRTENNVRLAVIFIGNPNSRGYSIAKNVSKSNALSEEEPLFYTSKSMSELGAIFKRVYTDITSSN
jgi:molecular chaperone DnaK